MYSQQQVNDVVRKICQEIAVLLPRDHVEAILFGSYARGDADAGSDIDVLVLVDSSRQKISDINWKIGSLAADFLVNEGIVVSPIVENRDYYLSNAEVLPFFRSIQYEGVKQIRRS